MAKTLTQVGIETGNLVEAYHVTQSIDAFTGVDAYDISLSGSLNITGSLSQGSGTQASGVFSHAEGQSTQAIGDVSHAEGQSTQAIGEYSHAEGEETTAQGAYSHAEGDSTTAIGTYSHAEGASTTATGPYSHAEGSNTIASGSYSHAEGLGTVASGSYQHVQGQFNLSSSAQSAFIIGNGTSDASRSNLVFASGSQFQVTGSVIATTGFTGSLQGTASFAVTASHVISASYAVTASHVISASYAVTASHVDLLAGPNITINKVGTTFEISGSGGGGGITPAETGSFYVSSSINSYTIEFNQGDGTTESVNITPFTYSLVTTQNYTFPLHPDNSGGSVFTLQTKDARFFLDDPANNSTFFLPDFVSEIGSVIEIFYEGDTGTLQISASKIGGGATIFLYNVGVSSAGGTVTSPTAEACYFRLMAISGSINPSYSGITVDRWRISNYWDDTIISDAASSVSDQLTFA
jgi:hypothetical protein